jgi:hypothetical protein
VTQATVPVHDRREPDWARAVVDDLERVNIAAASGVLTLAEVAELGAALNRAVELDAAWLPPALVARERGRVVYLPTYGEPFLSLAGHPGVFEPVDLLLGAGSLLYTMTSACTPAGGRGRPLHRDSTINVPGYAAALGIMILLDDFDEPSGATRFHPDVTDVEPDPATFTREAMRLVAPAGSVCWFHGAAWHDTTDNRSARDRRCVILASARPWIKQRFDVASMLADVDLTGLDPGAAARLGLDSLPPGSYAEYYLPAPERMAAARERARRGRASTGADHAPPTAVAVAQNHDRSET